MNTSKQVNAMVGLLMVFAVATLLYFLWDTVRAEDAEERQLADNAERGGRLYSLNCRACHGITGKGPLENPNLPGAPLNIEDNRPTDPGVLQAKQQRFRDTLRCGRVGTIMPPWLQENGGALNEFQVEQMVILITSAASAKGWENAIEQANHADELTKHLSEAVGASDTSLTLNNALGLKVDVILRIDDEPVDEVYELVKVVDAPVQTTLLEGTDGESTELRVEGTKGFQKGDIVQVDNEKMRVTSASGDLLRVERGVEDSEPASHQVKRRVFEVGNEIKVERGANNSQATEHVGGAEVFAGPIPPADTITGAPPATPPCGQRAPATAATPTGSPTPAASPTPVSGPLTIEMGDNFFQLDGQRNPTIGVKVGQTVSVTLKNNGIAGHNMRTAGEDTSYNTGDDDVSDPQLILGSGEGALEFTFDKSGTYDYRCDFHPTDMKGQIVVSE